MRAKRGGVFGTKNCGPSALAAASIGRREISGRRFALSSSSRSAPVGFERRIAVKYRGSCSVGIWHRINAGHHLCVGLTRRQSQRPWLSRRVLPHESRNETHRIQIVLSHTARQPRSWLIFDVRQKKTVAMRQISSSPIKPSGIGGESPAIFETCFRKRMKARQVFESDQRAVRLCGCVTRALVDDRRIALSEKKESAASIRSVQRAG